LLAPTFSNSPPFCAGTGFMFVIVVRG
jgi:hypothetical protein